MCQNRVVQKKESSVLLSRGYGLAEAKSSWQQNVTDAVEEVCPAEHKGKRNPSSLEVGRKTRKGSGRQMM